MNRTFASPDLRASRVQPRVSKSGSMVIVSLFDQYGKGNEDACVLILFYAFILKSSTEDVVLLKASLYY